jgi:hypothetical protein
MFRKRHLKYEYINKGIQFKKKEKSIGIPVIITDELFFNQLENKRIEFLKNTIFEKLNNLSEYIEGKKINLQRGLMVNDLQKEWNNNYKKDGIM